MTNYSRSDITNTVPTNGIISSIQQHQNIACENCKKSKRKCDHALPACGLCLKKGKECKYTNIDRRKHETQAYIQSLLDRIESLEEYIKTAQGSPLSDTTAPNWSKQRYNNINPQPKKRKSESNATITALLPTPKPNHIMDIPSLMSADHPTDVPLDFSPIRDNTLNNTEDANTETPNKKLHLNTNGPYLKTVYDMPLPSRWMVGFSASGKIQFQGPTSFRFIPSWNHNALHHIHINPSKELFDEFHKDIFSWFFEVQNNTFTLVDEKLFISSVQEAYEDGELGQYSSMALINTIMSLYFIFHNQPDEVKRFKELAISGVNDQVKNSPELVDVQTLILLAMVEMIEGNEFMSSEDIARAVAISYHLGLHVTTENIKREGKISPIESKLRENIFWSCFLVDKIRGIILGMHPYMNCTDISIKLDNMNAKSLIFENFKDYDTLKEHIRFFNMEIYLCTHCFASDLILGFDNTPIEKSLTEQNLVSSECLLTYSEWQRGLPPNTKYSNNKSMLTLMLEVFQLTFEILINKPLIFAPVDDNILVLSETNEIFRVNNKKAEIVFKAASTIIDLCSSNDLRKTLFIFRALYSVYVATIVSLFNVKSSNSNKRKKAKDLLKGGVSLLEDYSSYVPACDNYISNLISYKELWFGQESNILNEIFTDTYV